MKHKYPNNQNPSGATELSFAFRKSRAEYSDDTECMSDAFIDLFGHPCDGDDETQTAMWNDAMNMARQFVLPR